MWKDYAASIGTTAESLTKQQKIQAEVTGIMEETKFQMGDAAKISDSYSGQVLKMGYAFNNLKIAIGNTLIPILAAIIPYISAAINTRLFNTFAQVTSGIFGKQAKVQKATADSAKSTAQATGDAAKATNQLASAKKKAGKEADKASASFDEFNIISQNTGGSSDVSVPNASAGAVSATVDSLGDQEIGGNITISPKVQEAIDKIKKLFEPLKNIDFGPLQTSLNSLWDSLGKFGGKIGEGLVWLYQNVFVPLSQWTIQNALPVFLDLLGGAFDVLTAICQH